MATVEVTIGDVAFGGKGVGRLDGKAVFIPYTIDGESVVARVVREKKQFVEAEMVELREKSPHRVEAPCPYFGRCGGCAYQHISYDHQITTKSRQVENTLGRIGKIRDAPMQPMVPSPRPYSYRNRITVHVREGVVGFFERDSNRLIDIEQCPIATPEVNAELAQLRRNRPQEGHYTLRAGPGPRVFTQTNDDVAEKLAHLIEEKVPQEATRLIDAYCGAGFFSKRLLHRFEQVTGVDWDRFAIQAAQKNAEEKEEYIAGDVMLELTKAARAASPPQTVMIVDPPSTGLPEEVRNAILGIAPGTLLYVSCNPATLARDLAILRSEYEIESVTPLDMFPQTAEIEVLACLRTRLKESLASSEA